MMFMDFPDRYVCLPEGDTNIQQPTRCGLSMTPRRLQVARPRGRKWHWSFETPPAAPGLLLSSWKSSRNGWLGWDNQLCSWKTRENTINTKNTYVSVATWSSSTKKT